MDVYLTLRKGISLLIQTEQRLLLKVISIHPAKPGTSSGQSEYWPDLTSVFKPSTSSPEKWKGL